MRVLVAGGGIGGLSLAQGLLRRGIDVAVVERDRDVAATAGYKLHLGVRAVRALRELLAPEMVEVLLASSVSSHGFSLAVTDHRGRRLVRATEPEHGVSLDVDRTTLRLILAEGLGDALQLGLSLVGWRDASDGVVGHLDDGRELQADVLVIADGANSLLAKQRAGRPMSRPCGMWGVAGFSAWGSVSADARALLTGEPLLAVGPGGTGLFASRHDPAGEAAVCSELPSLTRTTEPSVIWGLLVAGAAAASWQIRRGAGARDQAAGVLRQHGWAERLSDLVVASAPGTVSSFRLHAADPTAIAPWRASRVTALGDAVHAMPPTGGQGAATAIMDAHVLARRLDDARLGRCTPVVAVHDYETEMRPRAARAVQDSLEPLTWIRGAATPVGSLVLRTIAPLAAGVVAASATLRGIRA